MGLFGKPNIEKLTAKRDIEKLINALDHKNWKIRKKAAEALGKIKDTSAINPLITALRDRNEEVQKKAMKALGQIRTPAVESLITRLKDDENFLVREKVAKALGEIKSKQAVEPLINALKHEFEYFVRREVAIALGKLKDKRAVESLITVLKNYDEKNAVRESAAEALGKIRDRRAIKPLEEALESGVYEVRAQARKALKKISGKEYKEKPIIIISDSEMVSKLRGLCNAYMQDDRFAINKLEPIATKIGRELDRRGGFSEMRRIFKKLEGFPGSRTLEMHWNGIGQWMG